MCWSFAAFGCDLWHFLLLLPGFLLIFVWHLQLSDSSLWVFGSLQFESYDLLFFWHPFKDWMWYLVDFYFLLVSDMSFCRTFDYFLELFPFVPLLCCYVCATLSFMFNLLSTSFLVFFILCSLSSVEIFFGHPLMINSCPCQLYSCNNKSVVRWCFCPFVWTCIFQDLLILLSQDNVINLIVYRDSLLCYRVSSSLRPSCNVLCRVLKAAVCDAFTIVITEFYQVGTILISSASWPLPNIAFRPSFSSYFTVEIPCQHSNGC